MSELSGGPISTEGAAPDQKVRVLIGWAGLNEEQWQDVIRNPEATEKISHVLEEIAALPQTVRPSSAPFTRGHHVINVRPLVIPVLVAAVVKVAVALSPNLESAILPWLDVFAVLERVNKIYRHLDDDEVDVFGVVASLSNLSETSPSVTDPTRFPSVDGIRSWFVKEGFEPPPDIESILESLKKKGAVSEKDGLYRPSFFGANE